MSKTQVDVNERDIANYLLALGFQPHLMGYQYTLSAIQAIIEDHTLLVSGITKCLYPMIAKKYNTTPGRVERAIRHSIEVAYSIHPLTWNQINYLGDYRPTNGCFLGTVAEVVRLKIAG